MKKNLIFSAIAVIALLIPSNATAAKHNVRHEHKAKARTEMRLAHGKTAKVTHVKHMAHRPIMGARFDRRPVNGRFITLNRNRLWLADGILYRLITTPTGIVYVVVGYW